MHSCGSQAQVQELGGYAYFGCNSQKRGDERRVVVVIDSPPEILGVWCGYGCRFNVGIRCQKNFLGPTKAKSDFRHDRNYNNLMLYCARTQGNSGGYMVMHGCELAARDRRSSKVKLGFDQAAHGLAAPRARRGLAVWKLGPYHSLQRCLRNELGETLCEVCRSRDLREGLEVTSEQSGCRIPRSFIAGCLELQLPRT